VISYKTAMDFLKQGHTDDSSQISKELSYVLNFYGKIEPRVIIACEREAYFSNDDPNLRITFDSNVRYRADDTELSHGSDGKPILHDGNYLMEIKTATAIPVYLSKMLSEQKIYPRSFSKVGTAYNDYYEYL
ncbi:MAG: VTC domain-containing protein, partial [Oscillospiraceae bacterium]|nr:VTC domain-containing protein [Candidatus Equicaccousia limihippi]